MSNKDGGYLIKLEENVDGEFKIVAFIGAHTNLPEPKASTLFYHIVNSIPELTEEEAREILNIQKLYDGYHINQEAETVTYKGKDYPRDPESITLNNFDDNIRLR